MLMNMRPRLSNEKTLRISKTMGKIKVGAKNYGKNVVGGAKIVGSAVKNKVLKAFKG